jgi:membrane protein YqaA with SNARE-associated domain
MLMGYAGLFLTAFLAATILPMSSEALLAALALSESFDAALLFVVATAGNVLGAMVNWLLGRFTLRWQDRPWFPVKPAELTRAARLFNRFGVWSLLLAWVPFIGDPLTVLAGALRTRFWLFAVLVTVGKAGRYAFLLAGLELASAGSA